MYLPEVTADDDTPTPSSHLMSLEVGAQYDDHNMMTMRGMGQGHDVRPDCLLSKQVS